MSVLFRPATLDDLGALMHLETTTFVTDAWSSDAMRGELASRHGWYAVAVDEGTDAILGYAGAAWGRGLHGDGAPAGRSGPVKREGDGRSPAGIHSASGRSRCSCCWRCWPRSSSSGSILNSPKGRKLQFPTPQLREWALVVGGWELTLFLLRMRR